MTPDILHLTPNGLQSVANADAGGLLVRPRVFQIGDFTTDDVSQFFNENGVPEELQGNVVHTGNIAYVQVVDRQTVRFTVDIPQNIPADPDTTDNVVPEVNIGEIIIRLEDNTTLGYCLYETPYIKRSNESIRIEVLMHVADGTAQTIDVTLSEFGSIPTVVEIQDLPAPVDAIANVIGVQNLLTNADGTETPGLVQKFGSGGAQWAPLGHTRVFNGIIGGGNVTNAGIFTIDEQVLTDSGMFEGEVVVVQCLQGDGAGETRKFELADNGSGLEFVANPTAFSNLSDISVINIWRRLDQNGGTACPWPPGGSDIPSDWILERGLGCPRWRPPIKLNGAGTTLYHPPGELIMNSYTLEPESTSGVRSFELYPLDVSQAQATRSQIHRYSHRKNNNYGYIALSGITQHRDAFELTENNIEFAEDLPQDTVIDARLFHLNPSSGHLLNIRYAEYTGDGTRTTFDIPVEGDEVVTSSDRLMIFVDSILQTNNLISRIENNQVVLTTPPPQGVPIEINAFIGQEVTGYATHVHTQAYLTRDVTNYLQLPFVPQDKGLVFVSEQGLHVNRSLYTIVDDRIIFRSSIDALRSVEIMIFRNVLSEGRPDQSINGVITDAVTTSKSIEFIRHNAERLRIPVPTFDVVGGQGITVRGTYPNYIIESDIAQQIAQDKPNSFSNQIAQKDSEEIIYDFPINFKGDVIVRATADFNAELGPGFSSDSGLETVQFVLGYRTASLNEPDYGRDMKGTGEVGFTQVKPGQADAKAYAHQSITQSFNLIKANNPQGQIRIIAKMRVRNGRVSDYGSRLKINLDVQITPSLGDGTTS